MHVQRWNLIVASVGKDAGVGYVRDNDLHLGIELTIVNLFDDGTKVGAFARSEHSELESLLHFSWIARSSAFVDLPGTKGRSLICAPTSRSEETSSGFNESILDSPPLL